MGVGSRVFCARLRTGRLVRIDVENDSRSILLGGREWRTAIDPPREPLARDAMSATADELAAAFAAAWTCDAALPVGFGARLVELCVEARKVHPTLVAALGSSAEANGSGGGGGGAGGGGGGEREGAIALATAIAIRAPRDAALLGAYLERCHVADLALALAAARGVGVAIAEVERAYRATIDSTCRRFANATHSADDLKQILRTKLFVGETPKIADYAGQGFLENWLRVTAVRVFLDLAKRKDRAREQAALDDDVLALPQPGDLALDVVKAEYREAVTVAMHEAAKRLAPGDRHLLRQHFVAGLSIDQLGAVLGIHRATAARRISRAREQLVAETRTQLAARLRLEAAELDEVFGLVMSRLDVSLSRLFATGPTRP